VFYFDGASNVQKAGEILMAKFPRSFCFHGGEHVVSLFFSSIAKIKPVKVVHHHAMLLLNLCQSNTHLIYLSCRLYNGFGSGASHAIYAQFMAQSALANRGQKVCLIRGAGTRMALWFYTMMRLIRLQQPLKANIHQQKFLNQTLTTSAKGAVQDIKEDNFWIVQSLTHSDSGFIPIWGPTYVHPTSCRVSCAQSSSIL
jgi:hypothetical protein